jgi:O-6-methylguanine DNA methyltransferase
VDDDEQRPLARAHALVHGLRALREVDCPASLAPAVLTRLGLGDAYFPLQTPLGRVYVATNGVGISAVMQASTPAEFEDAFRVQFGRPTYPAVRPPARLVRLLTLMLSGAAPSVVRFDLRGLTEFERAVLRKALEIPRGEVRPYAWIAWEIGHPRAVRAVGSALGHNPVPLFIPCHRVVRLDGQIGHYGLGGPEAKRTILEAEGVRPEALETLARAGVRYFGSQTTHIYCFPTCRHARRVTERHRVTFGSAAEAAAAGYRPCKVCRPSAAS